jgi:squalene-associated FAD-dependent desaturase
MRKKPESHTGHYGWTSEKSRTKQMIAVIGGGIAGLTAAIRLAEQGHHIELFEAAPTLGGRTRSFYEKTIGEWCDNGPHLLVGAYTATQALLHECGAADNIHWQKSLDLPLWDKNRGHFRLRPTPLLPLPLSLMLALARLPDHGIKSALALTRLAGRAGKASGQTVEQWLAHLQTPMPLVRDLIEPLCLGAMNEYPATAPALSFQRVLEESFDNHRSARLGWFNQPLSEALVQPLQARAEQLGVSIQTGSMIHSMTPHPGGIRVTWGSSTRDFDKVILTTPSWVSNKLLGIKTTVESRPISNIHLWFDDPVHPGFSPCPPLIGGIGTRGQWFFDVSSQMSRASNFHHIAVVISADYLDARRENLVKLATHELGLISGLEHPLKPVHARVIQEKRATALTRLPDTLQYQVPKCLIDASERPHPGDLPATIEAAVLRGEQAAEKCAMSQ